jgi:hypothetical protein
MIDKKGSWFIPYLYDFLISRPSVFFAQSFLVLSPFLRKERKKKKKVLDDQYQPNFVFYESQCCIFSFQWIIFPLSLLYCYYFCKLSEWHVV